MQNWLLQRAYLTPERAALTYKETTYSWYELVDAAKHRARQLTTATIKKGERVAILAPSTDELVITIYACMLLQCEMVMLNRRLSATELAYQITDAEVDHVIVARCDRDKVNTTYVLLEDVRALAPSRVLFDEQWQEKATLSIMYTSGTTGSPKGVRQTYGNHQASALAAALNVGVSPTDVWLCTMPIFHISGLSILMRAVIYGNEVVLYEKFDVIKVVEAIVQGRVTHMSVVAFTLQQILQQMTEQNIDVPPSFKLMLAGGGAIPEAYLTKANVLGLAVAQTYGMTETASQTATLAPEYALSKLGSSGKALFFNTIRIDGATAAYEHGEICIKGPHITPGYVGRFNELSATSDGWLYTGDIGYFDEEGFLYVVDRRSDLIISGGENIYPAEIENVLHAHAAVHEAGVCGVTDDKWGSVPVAYVVTKEAVTAEQLREHCTAQLAAYKVPKQIYFVDALPRNGANKLLRRKLNQSE